MLPDAPVLLELLFFFICAASLCLLHNALETVNKKTANVVTLMMIGWGMLQSALSDNGYYRDYQTFPPRLFMVGILPILIVIVTVLIYPPTRNRLIRICLESLTWIHVIRIPVELTLLWLFVQNAVPELMTAGGYNFDIIAGCTAPLVAYYGIRYRKMNRRLLLAWNIFCLGLLLIIITTSILSAPFPFQQLAEDQPNIAIFYFPYTLLPTVIVPVVLFAQLLSIIKLCSRKKNAIYCRRPYSFAAWTKF
jgi:hypothetical protein